MYGLSNIAMLVMALAAIPYDAEAISLKKDRLISRGESEWNWTRSSLTLSSELVDERDLRSGEGGSSGSNNVAEESLLSQSVARAGGVYRPPGIRPQVSVFSRRPNRECGWKGSCNGKANEVRIGAGNRAYDIAPRDEAQRICGKVCDASADCGGFQYVANKCYYRQKTGCGVFKDSGSDCWEKKIEFLPVEELSNFSQINFNDRGDSDLNMLKTYSYTLNNGYTCLMTGWTNTRKSAKGFVRLKKPGVAQAVVTGLVPGAVYAYRLFQFAKSKGSTNRLRVTGMLDSKTTAHDSDVPTQSSTAVATADGKIKFSFTKDADSIHLSGLTLARMVAPGTKLYEVARKGSPGCPYGFTTIGSQKQCKAAFHWLGRTDGTMTQYASSKWWVGKDPKLPPFCSVRDNQGPFGHFNNMTQGIGSADLSPMCKRELDSGEFKKMALGDSGCALGTAVRSAQMCDKAVRSFGITGLVVSEEETEDLPLGCSVRPSLNGQPVAKFNSNTVWTSDPLWGTVHFLAPITSHWASSIDDGNSPAKMLGNFDKALWRSVNKSKEWFLLDLRKPLNVDGVKVKGVSGKLVKCSPKKMELQTGDTSTGPWQTAISFTGDSKGGWSEAKLKTSVISQYLRLFVRDNYGGPNVIVTSFLLKVEEDLKLKGFREEAFNMSVQPKVVPNLPSDLDKQKPQFMRVVKWVVQYQPTKTGFPGYLQKDKLIVRWTGYLKIKQPGPYEFHLQSGGPSKLFMNELLVVQNNKKVSRNVMPSIASFRTAFENQMSVKKDGSVTVKPYNLHDPKEKLHTISNGDGTWSFKSHYGKYCSEEKGGIISCKKAKIGPDEKFKVKHDLTGMSVITARSGGFWEAVSQNRIKATAKFKPSKRWRIVSRDPLPPCVGIKSSKSGKYVRVDKKAKVLKADSPWLRSKESFKVIYYKDGSAALKTSDGEYLSEYNNYHYTATKKISKTERFYVKRFVDGNATLQSDGKGHFAGAFWTSFPDGSMIATPGFFGEEEKKWQIVSCEPPLVGYSAKESKPLAAGQHLLQIMYVPEGDMSLELKWKGADTNNKLRFMSPDVLQAPRKHGKGVKDLSPVCMKDGEVDNKLCTLEENSLNDRGNSSLDTNKFYEYETCNGYKVRLRGWTHTRTDRKGYVRNKKGVAEAIVRGLKPGGVYAYNIFQYASQKKPWPTRISINGMFNFVATPHKSDVPSNTGSCIATAEGEVKVFMFAESDDDSHKISLSGLSFEPLELPAYAIYERCSLGARSCAACHMDPVDTPSECAKALASMGMTKEAWSEWGTDVDVPEFCSVVPGSKAIFKEPSPSAGRKDVSPVCKTQVSKSLRAKMALLASMQYKIEQEGASKCTGGYEYVKSEVECAKAVEALGYQELAWKPNWWVDKSNAQPSFCSVTFNPNPNGDGRVYFNYAPNGKGRVGISLVCKKEAKWYHAFWVADPLWSRDGVKASRVWFSNALDAASSPRNLLGSTGQKKWRTKPGLMTNQWFILDLGLALHVEALKVKGDTASAANCPKNMRFQSGLSFQGPWIDEVNFVGDSKGGWVKAQLPAPFVSRYWRLYVDDTFGKAGKGKNSLTIGGFDLLVEDKGKAAKSWRVLYARGTFGSHRMRKLTFNKLFWTAHTGILKVEWASKHGHLYVLYFKRLWYPETWDAYDGLFKKWTGTQKSFGIYRSLDDALNDVPYDLSPTWSTLPDRQLAPNCTAKEFQGSKGVKNTAAECFAAVKKDSKANFAVWRGSSDKHCHVCKIRTRTSLPWKYVYKKGDTCFSLEKINLKWTTLGSKGVPNLKYSVYQADIGRPRLMGGGILPYTFRGCFRERQEGSIKLRDLPNQMKPAGKDHMQCMAACKKAKFRFFSLQRKRECWCGNDFGKYEKTSGCRCSHPFIGRGKSCVYRIEEIELEAAPPYTLMVKGVSRCPDGQRITAEQDCQAGYFLLKPTLKLKVININLGSNGCLLKGKSGKTRVVCGQAMYSFFVKDKFCKGEVLANAGGKVKKNSYKSSSICQASCDKDPRCKLFLWKDNPKAKGWKYQCATFTGCKAPENYVDGDSAMVYKKIETALATPSCNPTFCPKAAVCEEDEFSCKVPGKVCKAHPKGLHRYCAPPGSGDPHNVRCNNGDCVMSPSECSLRGGITHFAAQCEPKCNPTPCPYGIVCKKYPHKCCKRGDWSCCGDFDPWRYHERLYCPSKDVNNVMCNDGSCRPDAAQCVKNGGVRYSADLCPGAQDYLKDDEDSNWGVIWRPLFEEAAGTGNGPQFDNSDERTLNYKLKGTRGGDYFVKLSWGVGYRRWISFRVPLGSDIFSKANKNIPIHEVTTSSGFEPSFVDGGKHARFCKACEKNGAKAKDTCWALTTMKDKSRKNGCSDPKWGGEGIYYGGVKNLGGGKIGEGGGFAGPKIDGRAKGNISSMGLKFEVGVKTRRSYNQFRKGCEPNSQLGDPIDKTTSTTCSYKCDDHPLCVGFEFTPTLFGKRGRCILKKSVDKKSPCSKGVEFFKKHLWPSWPTYSQYMKDKQCFGRLAALSGNSTVLSRKTCSKLCAFNKNCRYYLYAKSKVVGQFLCYQYADCADKMLFNDGSHAVVYEKSNDQYMRVGQDKVCLGGKTLYDGGGSKPAKHYASRRACQLKCSTDDNCEFYLWKKEIRLGIKQPYHCMTFSRCDRVKDYEDGFIAKIYMKDPNPGPIPALQYGPQNNCNPTFCPLGLVCKDDPMTCCKPGDWQCCGKKGTARFLGNRKYCPTRHRQRILCANGECVSSESRCKAHGGLKLSAVICAPKCNPTPCPYGITCKSNPTKCCKKGDWGCCADFDPWRVHNRFACPSHSLNNVMCKDGRCRPTERHCRKYGGAKFSADVCEGVQDHLDVMPAHFQSRTKWHVVYKELNGVGNALNGSDDELDIRTLNFPKLQGVAKGDYWVRLRWISKVNESEYVMFYVPTGQNIFDQTKGNVNIDVDDVTTSGGFYPEFANGGKKARFCHACTKNGTRWGSTCWALTTEKDSHRKCGCNDNDGQGGGGKGQGIYYGGYKKADSGKCRGDGGGFAGPKLNGEKKGNQFSIGFILEVGFEEFVAPPITWTTVWEEDAGSGNATRLTNPEDAQTLYFPNLQGVDKGNYWIRMTWPGGQGLTFHVPRGRTIFNQNKSNLGIPIQDVYAVGGFTPSFSRKAEFCIACVKGGIRFGHTCWGVLPNNKLYPDCGCSSTGWKGSGVFYGGMPKADKCPNNGGAFLGPSSSGKPKNGNSIGLKFEVGIPGTHTATKVYTLEPKGVEKCSQPVSEDIKEVQRCQNAFDALKIKYKLKVTRAIQVGSFKGIPVGCSIQFDNPKMDQAPYFNIEKTSDNARAKTGEFRVVCMQRSACADGSDDAVFVPGKVIGCSAKWNVSGIDKAASACGEFFEMCSDEKQAERLGLTRKQCEGNAGDGKFYSSATLSGCGKDGHAVRFAMRGNSTFSKFLMRGRDYGNWEGLLGSGDLSKNVTKPKIGNGGALCCSNGSSPQRPAPAPAAAPAPAKPKSDEREDYFGKVGEVWRDAPPGTWFGLKSQDEVKIFLKPDFSAAMHYIKDHQLIIIKGAWELDKADILITWKPKDFGPYRFQTLDKGESWIDLEARRWMTTPIPKKLLAMILDALRKVEKAVEAKLVTKPGQPTHFVKHGCRRPEGEDKDPFVADLGMTITRCFIHCAGTAKDGNKYFSLTRGKQCFCSIVVPGTEISEDKCDMKCEGNTRETCGGLAAASVFTMIDCIPPSQEELDAETKRRRDELLGHYAMWKGESCGQNELAQLDGSSRKAGTVDDCKEACWQADGAETCHGFTYDALLSKCTFVVDVLDGKVIKKSNLACYWKKVGLKDYASNLPGWKIITRGK